MGPMTTSYKFGSVLLWSVFFILLGESALGETTCMRIYYSIMCYTCTYLVQSNTMSLEFSGIHFKSVFYNTIWIELTNVHNAIITLLLITG